MAINKTLKDPFPFSYEVECSNENFYVKHVKKRVKGSSNLIA